MNFYMEKHLERKGKHEEGKDNSVVIVLYEWHLYILYFVFVMHSTSIELGRRKETFDQIKFPDDINHAHPFFW